MAGHLCALIYFCLFFAFAIGGGLGVLFTRDQQRPANIFAVFSVAAGVLFFLCFIYAIFIPQLYLSCPMQPATAPSPIPGGPPVTLPTTDLQAEYFAMQTMTTVGFGLNLDARHDEQFYYIANLSMISGAALWTLAIGVISSIVNQICVAVSDQDDRQSATKP